MCGDLEEDDAAETRAFEAFRYHAGRLVAGIDSKGRRDADDVNAYLDRLFADIITRIAEGPAGPGITDHQRLSLTPLVLARVAGILSGHVSPAEDPLRRAIEALMLGYGEPEAFFRDRHDHDHHHDHDHEHEHGHGHHHGHSH